MSHVEEKLNTLQLLIEKKSLFGGFASAEILNFKIIGVNNLPRVIHMTQKSVFIECEFISPEEDAVKAAEQVSTMYCRKLNMVTGQYEPKCGFCKECVERKLEFYCFSPQSPYLLALKEELKKAKIQVR